MTFSFISTDTFYISFTGPVMKTEVLLFLVFNLRIRQTAHSLQEVKSSQLWNQVQGFLDFQ